MSRHDELRAALRRPHPSAPPDWDDVRTRAHRIHRRRRITQGTVVLALIVAVTLGALAASGAFDPDTDRSIIATPTEQQGEIVVAFDDRIVVMTTDGDIVRTLVDGLDLVGNISVSPEGEYVYFAHGSGCVHGPSPKIARVPTAGEEIENLGRGLHPLVSPDGARVAWELSDPACGSVTNRIVVAGADGSERLRYGARPDDAVIALEPLAWTRDSTELLVVTEQHGRPGSRLIARMPLVGNAYPIFPPFPAATFLTDDELLVAERSGEAGDAYVVHTVSTDGQPGVLRFEATGPVPHRLLPEPNGQRLLVLATGGSLQLQEGSETPRTIATGVEGAAWLPRIVPVPSTTTTTAPEPTLDTSPPARVVALTGAGET